MNFLRKIFEGKEKERKNALLIVFLVGLLLITFTPKLTQKNDTSTILAPQQEQLTSQGSYEQTLEQRLETILSNVQGAGEVDVMVSIKKSSEKVVSENIEQSSNVVNEADNSSGTRTTEQSTLKKSAMLLNQNETPLVLTEIMPEISGVIIVTTGAKDVYVKDALIRSVSTLLEIPSYKVEVLQKK